MTSASPMMIGIVGWKNSGKTTLVVRLVEKLSQRGLKIATVKYAHHAPRLPDGSTDSERHKQAGASEVIAIFPERWEISGRAGNGPPPDLTQIAARLQAADLILIEGNKRVPIPKIEVRRSETETRDPLTREDYNIVAVAADHDTETHGRPGFALDDIEGIAAFIENLHGRHTAQVAFHLRREERDQTSRPRRAK